MIADTLYNRISTGVSYTETLTGNTIDECLTTCGTIESNVTNDNIFFCLEPAVCRRIYHNLTTGKTFSEVIIGIPLQL